MFLFFVCFIDGARADSPLTSTNFSRAYFDVPTFGAASGSKGILSPELVDYLFKEENPIDLSLAVINAVSWDKEVQSAEVFFTYLREKIEYPDMEDFLLNRSASHILCLAYLKAMDDYIEVSEALRYAELAFLKSTKSVSYSIIMSLIKAQFLMEYDGCQFPKLHGEIRLKRPSSSVSNPYLIGKKFKIKWNWKIRRA